MNLVTKENQLKMFKPGVSGNPSGRPKEPEALKKLKLYTNQEIQMKICEFLDMTKAEIKAKIEDPATTMLEVMIGTIMVKGAQNGDQNRLESMINRVAGKVKDEVDHKHTILMEKIKQFEEMNDSELTKYIQENVKLNQKEEG